VANSPVITGHSTGVRGRFGRGTGYPGDRAVMKMPVHAADRPKATRSIRRRCKGDERFQALL
jgi:hypothetical protein